MKCLLVPVHVLYIIVHHWMASLRLLLLITCHFVFVIWFIERHYISRMYLELRPCLIYAKGWVLFCLTSPCCSAHTHSLTCFTSEQSLIIDLPLQIIIVSAHIYTLTLSIRSFTVSKKFRFRKTLTFLLYYIELLSQ